MAFTPKDKTWGHYEQAEWAIAQKWGATGPIFVAVPYDYSKHYFCFVWPYSDTFKNEKGEFVSGKFAYPTTFSFKQRYRMLKEKGWHCGGPHSEKECFIFHYKLDNGSNSNLKIILKWSGDLVFWIGGNQFGKVDSTDAIINMLTMFA